MKFGVFMWEMGCAVCYFAAHFQIRFEIKKRNWWLEVSLQASEPILARSKSAFPLPRWGVATSI
jgi:hypothetical protein